jgi:hypothetical protein
MRLTVEAKIAEIRRKYGIKDVIFAGDRGMVTMAQYEKMDHDIVKVISALTHKKIQALREAGTIQIGMFDEKDIVEVIDGNVRYSLCKNPDMAAKETQIKAVFIKKTREELTKIAASTRKGKNSKAVRAGKALEKYKVAKFFRVTGDGDTFTFSIDDAMIAEEQALDGCYVVFTDVYFKGHRFFSQKMRLKSRKTKI